MAKTEKPAAGKPAADETPSGGSSMINIILVCALVAAALVGGYVYFVRGAQHDPDAPKKDPDLAELMKPGALPDMSLGSQDAPNVIVEYASMTCPHCAQFDKVVFPELKTKYIDTGKARLIFREFPLDGLAARASMLARCAGPDRYFAMIDVMFQTQAELGGGGTRSARPPAPARAPGRILQGEVRCLPRRQGSVQEDRR